MRTLRHRDCVQLFMAVDDAVALRSTIVAEGLAFRPAPARFAGAAGELLEVRLGACACALVKAEPGRLVEVIRRLLASERRVQVLLQATGAEPALTHAPVTVVARALFAGGAAQLPRGEVVEVVLTVPDRD